MTSSSSGKRLKIYNPPSSGNMFAQLECGWKPSWRDFDLSKKAAKTPRILYVVKHCKLVLKAAMEVVSMRAQYVRDIFEHGIDEMKYMAFFEQRNDAVHSGTYHSPGEALTG